MLRETIVSCSCCISKADRARADADRAHLMMHETAPARADRIHEELAQPERKLLPKPLTAARRQELKDKKWRDQETDGSYMHSSIFTGQRGLK